MAAGRGRTMSAQPLPAWSQRCQRPRERRRGAVPRAVVAVSSSPSRAVPAMIGGGDRRRRHRGDHGGRGGVRVRAAGAVACAPHAHAHATPTSAGAEHVLRPVAPVSAQLPSVVPLQRSHWRARQRRRAGPLPSPPSASRRRARAPETAGSAVFGGAGGAPRSRPAWPPSRATAEPAEFVAVTRTRSSLPSSTASTA